MVLSPARESYATTCTYAHAHAREDITCPTQTLLVLPDARTFPPGAERREKPKTRHSRDETGRTERPQLRQHLLVLGPTPTTITHITTLITAILAQSGRAYRSIWQLREAQPSSFP